MQSCGQKCFLAFGTLLFLIRDKKFNIDSDIDIGIIGDPSQTINAFQGLFEPLSVVRDNITNEPYNMHFISSYLGCTVDVFWWKKRDGYYYHTYDHQLCNPIDGKLPEYEFKGVEADCFDVKMDVIKAYQEDLRYGRALNGYGCWLHPVPGIEEEGIVLPVPWSYGKALDQWYPNWAIPNPQFGVSESPSRFTVKTCKGLKWA